MFSDIGVAFALALYLGLLLMVMIYGCFGVL